MRRLGRRFFSLIAVTALGVCGGAQVRAADVVQTLAPGSSTDPHLTSKAVASSAAHSPSTPAAPAAPAATTAAIASTHGMWVWRTLFHLNAGASSPLVATAKTAGVTEVYLAVDKKIMADKRLPAFIATLQKAGLRVSALMGDATWYQPAQQANMLSMVDSVGAFNAANPNSRFTGVHFDIEPHQLPQNKGSRAYLPALADTIRMGRDRAMKYAMDCAADLPRFAIDDSPQTRHAFAGAVPRLFLMLYELKDKGTPALTAAATSTTNNEYQSEPGGMLVIGVSVDDYPNVATNLRALDAAKPGGAHYGGWAIHDETRYTARLAQHGQ
jgi:hypothetical protein